MSILSSLSLKTGGLIKMEDKNMNNIILEMKGITKEFPGVKALDNVDLKVYDGEIVSIIGENGAGKSTLMKILSGVYPHDTISGEIYINGDSKKFEDTRDSSDSGIQMIYQENSPILDLTIAENIFVGNFPKKANNLIDWEKINSKTKELLKLVNLDLDPDTKMRKLSASQHQLIFIIKAINKEGKILILDEPTSSLTKEETKNLFKIINDLKEKGISCIYISHKLDEVFEISDRIVVLRDGSKVDTFEKGNFNYESIISAMVGRNIEEMYPDKPDYRKNKILQINNLTVQHPYNAKENILEDISFDLKAGEVLGLVGLVGSGRSELVNAIFGNGKMIKGDIIVRGNKVSIKTPKDAIKNKIALVTEDRKENGLVLMKSIKENISLASFNKITQNLKLDFEKEKKYAKKYMNNLNIKANDIEVDAVKLSGGNQQKVVLGKWLMTDPDILILDEPTRGIDVGAKQEIYKMINELASDGIGIIMISSEMPELAEMCDRFLVLRDKKIEYILDKKDEEITENKLLLAASGGLNI